MLPREEYIRLSLLYNLFWLRIMKEHAIFMESMMLPPARLLSAQADRYKQQFERLLATAIRLAGGALPKDVLQSGQYYTRYTEEAERITQKHTGILINSDLTRMAYDIEPYSPHVPITAGKEQEISQFNTNILNQTIAFIRFKSEILSSQTTCNLFTLMYTAVLEHILHEGQYYIEILQRLQRRDETVAAGYKEVWLHNMAEHAAVMRGLFDPTEKKPIEIANQFAHAFESLLQTELQFINGEALADTEAFSEFKANTTRAIIECKVKSIMLPLFTDHLLREANHFIYLMQS